MPNDPAAYAPTNTEEDPEPPTQPLSDFNMDQANLRFLKALNHQDSKLAEAFRNHEIQITFQQTDEDHHTLANLRFAVTDAVLMMHPDHKLQFAREITHQLTDPTTAKLDSLAKSYDDALSQDPFNTYLQEINRSLQETAYLTHEAKEQAANQFSLRNQAASHWPGDPHWSEKLLAEETAGQLGHIKELSDRAVHNAAETAAQHLEDLSLHMDQRQAATQLFHSLTAPLDKGAKDLAYNNSRPTTEYKDYLNLHQPDHPDTKTIHTLGMLYGSETTRFLSSFSAETQAFREKLNQDFQSGADPTILAETALNHVADRAPALHHHSTSQAQAERLHSAFERYNLNTTSQQRHDSAQSFAEAITWPSHEKLLEQSLAFHDSSPQIPDPETYNEIMDIIGIDTLHRADNIKRSLAADLESGQYDYSTITSSLEDMDKALEYLKHITETLDPPNEFSQGHLQDRYDKADRDRTSNIMENLEAHIQQVFPQANISYTSLINDHSHRPLLDAFFEQHPLGDHQRIAEEIHKKASAETDE